MGMFVTMDHTCAVVSDLEKALVFWQDTLGWKVALDTELSGPRLSGPRVERLLGLPGVKGRAVLLSPAGKLGTGMMELVEISSPAGKPFPPDEKFNDVGLRLVSLTVSDIDRAYEELQSKGCRFESAPVTFEISGRVVGKACIFREPVDGFSIELMERMGSKT